MRETLEHDEGAHNVVLYIGGVWLIGFRETGWTDTTNELMEKNTYVHPKKQISQTLRCSPSLTLRRAFTSRSYCAMIALTHARTTCTQAYPSTNSRGNGNNVRRTSIHANIYCSICTHILHQHPSTCEKVWRTISNRIAFVRDGGRRGINVVCVVLFVGLQTQWRAIGLSL